jgi:hypothetical protein
MSPPSSGSTTARPIITLTSTVAADDEVEEVDTEEEEEEEIEASSEDEVMDAMADPADVEQSFGGVREEKSTILGDEEGEPLADDGRSTGIEGMKAVGGSAAEGGMLASGGTRKKVCVFSPAKAPTLQSSSMFAHVTRASSDINTQLMP